MFSSSKLCLLYVVLLHSGTYLWFARGMSTFQLDCILFSTFYFYLINIWNLSYSGSVTVFKYCSRFFFFSSSHKWLTERHASDSNRAWHGQLLYSAAAAFSVAFIQIYWRRKIPIVFSLKAFFQFQLNWSLHWGTFQFTEKAPIDGAQRVR